MLKVQAPVDLVMAETCCWKCKASTPVSSLRAQAATDCEGDTVEGVRITNAVELPQEWTKTIHDLNPNFRKAFSPTAAKSYLANHCNHCGALMGDFFLHMEPDGPFFGGAVPEGATITRLRESGEWDIESGYCY